MNDAERRLLEGVLKSPAYVRADLDLDLLAKPELRPVRMQLELLKPEMLMVEHGVRSTIVLFGSARILERSAAEKRVESLKADAERTPGEPLAKRRMEQAERLLEKSRYYEEAREFARIVSSSCQIEGVCDYVILTGGGPGIMEAGNRGAADVAAMSVGLNITLPFEQAPNPYITPELCFLFRYFALRKFHFLLRAKALVVYPGGFGTLDELFETLTLRQTNKMQAIPVVLVGREYWDRAVNWRFLADEGVISDEDLDLISYAETPQETWDVVQKFHNLRGSP